MEFDLIPDVRDVRISIATMMGVLGPIIVGVWTFAALGRLDWSTAFSFAVFVLVVTPVLIFSNTRARFGKITVDGDGIAVRKRLVQLRYPWRDIGTLESAVEPGISVPVISRLARWSGAPKENRFVRLKLRDTAKSRSGLINGTWLRLVWGGSDSFRLATPDPAAVISAAGKWWTG